MTDGGDKRGGAGSGSGSRVIVFAVLFATMMLSLPWAGIGYCMFIGNPICPVILSPAPTQPTDRNEPGAAPSDRNTAPAASGGPTTAAPRGPGVVPSGSGAASSDYIALVIGNSAYTPPNDLNNPRNDAQDMAAALKELGYALVGGAAHFDIESKRDMLALLDQFTLQADAAKVALIYYAGHGVQYGGENYLIPTKATLKSARQLKLQTVSMGEINAALPAQKISIVIFDACRSPPSFPLEDDDGRSRGSDTRTIAVVRAPNRSYFAFSSSAGEPAKDGVGRNSPYVAKLLQRMREPGIEVERVFKKVQDDFRLTDHRQRPDNSDQLGVVEVPFAAALPLPPPGTVFRDCDECPEMVVVPKGKFYMGAPKTEEGSSDNERPQHWVTIARDFAVGRFEVTFAEYDACVVASACVERPSDDGWGRGNRPVINVSWSDAQIYLRWLNTKLGRNRGKYRLLSEAEWEYAARAGTTTPFFFGTTITPAQANYNGSVTYGSGPKGVYRRKTMPVGRFPPNTFGLFDMHGNVWEWTDDCWNESYKGAPSDGQAWTTSGDCSRRRVLRGGSWHGDPTYLRSAFRDRNGSANRNVIIGFRLARTN